MPYKIKRANIRKNCYTVYNTQNKHVFAKCSTKNKAKKQISLLHAIMYNPSFKPYRRTINHKGKKRNKHHNNYDVKNKLNKTYKNK